MKLTRWLSFILMLGLVLAFYPMSAQARPYFEDHPRWRGNGHHDFDHHRKHFRHSWRGPHPHRNHPHYAGPPPVVYVQPVTPVMPYPAPQPYFPQPAPPGLHGQFSFGF